MLLAIQKNDRSHANEFALNIYKEHHPWIKMIIRQMVRNPEDREDIYQDFFISLLTNPDLARKSQHKGYLKAALTHDIIDFIRQRSSYHKHLEQYAHKTFVNTATGNVLEGLVSNEQCTNIIQLIEEKLPLSVRTTLKLYLERNRNYKVIAREMNICAASARRYIYLGRKKLKGHFLKRQIDFKSNFVNRK